jgi:hypothetical protein
MDPYGLWLSNQTCVWVKSSFNVTLVHVQIYTSKISYCTWYMCKSEVTWYIDVKIGSHMIHWCVGVKSHDSLMCWSEVTWYIDVKMGSHMLHWCVRVKSHDSLMCWNEVTWYINVERSHMIYVCLRGKSHDTLMCKREVTWHMLGNNIIGFNMGYLWFLSGA